MSERACGIHALDAAPNDACPHCTRARIQARDEEIERLRQENNRLHTECGHREADVAELRRELAVARAALNEVAQEAVHFTNGSGTHSLYFSVSDDWLERAARAAGGAE